MSFMGHRIETLKASYALSKVKNEIELPNFDKRRISQPKTQ